MSETETKNKEPAMMTATEKNEMMSELMKDRRDWTSLLNSTKDEFYRTQIMKRLDHIESCIRAINPEF